MPDTFFLYPLQAAVREFLWAEPFMQSFAIVTEDKEEILQQLDQALMGTLPSPNGKTGCSILIHTAVGKGAIQNIPGLYSLAVDVHFIVAEQPALNRRTETNPTATGYSALQVIEYLAALMKQYKSTEVPTNFYEDENPMSAPVLDNETGLIIHTLVMHCHGGITVDTLTVPAPSISLDAATRQATLTDAMDGVLIFYTLDGRAPRYFGDGNPNNIGTLYTGAFDASAAETIRARAYFPGWRASTITALDTRAALRSENPEDLLEESGATLKAE